MPELPEVETMRRGILPITGHRVEAIVVPKCKLKPISIRPQPPTLRKRAVGRTIREIQRIGKRVVMCLDNDDSLVFEPRMTGLVLLADPPNQEHLRLRIELKGPSRHEQLLFWDRRGLGSVRLFSADQLSDQFGPKKLGPDALAISAVQLRERLRHSKQAIKVALLDQKKIAGIGNLYASEMLHTAGIDPRRRCCRLTKEQWHALHAQMVEVLQEAIRYEGSTLSDGTYRNALNKVGGYQNEHRVYARAGQLCPTCRKAEIRRFVQAQRSTFVCPVCQG